MTYPALWEKSLENAAETAQIAIALFSLVERSSRDKNADCGAPFLSYRTLFAINFCLLTLPSLFPSF
jgi:hypothetical protein